VGTGRVDAAYDDPAQRQELGGRTLCQFANDTARPSNCNVGCAANWPALHADKGAVGTGDYSLVARDDCTTQWAYRTQPLYFYAADSAPGDTLGDVSAEHDGRAALSPDVVYYLRAARGCPQDK